MKVWWIIGIAVLTLIVWQWRRIRFYLLEYPFVNTDGVTINGKPWREYVTATYFTVGDVKVYSKVESQIKTILADTTGLYDLYQSGPARHKTDSLSALIVLEAIDKADDQPSVQLKPVF